LQVLYFSDRVRAIRTGGATGELTTDEALAQLLSGTGLTYRYVSDKAVTILSVTDAAASGSAPGQAASAPAAEAQREGKKSSSAGFHVAQVDQGQTSSPSTVEKPDEQASKKKPIQLQEVVVTGSRIPQRATEGAQEVKIYTREQIEQSGQTTIADFLDTTPSVSIAVGENGLQTVFGSSTVQLRGLPQGTTLVLLNGRRLQTSGSQSSSDFFDLNNIPLAAVERIEVVADGSSAIYGSDAIAGVVNIILKKDVEGIEADAQYGGASDVHESNASFLLGHHWEQGSISLIGSYQSRSDLVRSARALTASQDYTAYGGPNNNGPFCNPGNVFSVDGTPLPGLGSATFAAVPHGFTGTPTIAEFQGTAGTLNECSASAAGSIIPATRRTGALLQGNYQLTSTAELFTELLYSHVDELQEFSSAGIYGFPGSPSFTLSASNPYNPFGETVGVGTLFPTLPPVGQSLKTDFLHAVLGARGMRKHRRRAPGHITVESFW